MKFIKEEPLHKSVAGKALEDMMRIMTPGSVMEYTYKTLDEHLITGTFQLFEEADILFYYECITNNISHAF